MSKDNHSFSVSVACEVGVIGAILLQHISFLQKSFATDGENWQKKWVKRPAKALAATYPYLTPKQAWSALDTLEKDGYLASQIANPTKYDRSKSYKLTDKGLILFGELAFSILENGISEMENENSESENDIKVDSSSFNSSFGKEESADANAPLLPPFKETGEFLDLEAEKGKTTTPGAGGAIRATIYDPAAPDFEIHDEVKPAPQTPPEKTGRAQKQRGDTQEEIEFAAEIIAYLNEKAGRQFRVNAGTNAKGILARRKEGFTADEMKRVIDFKVERWGKDPEMCEHLNPETLFRPSKFEKYLAAANAPKQSATPKQQLRATLNHFGAGDYDPNIKQAF